MKKIESNWYYIKLPEDYNADNKLVPEFVEELEKALPPTRCIEIIEGVWRHHHKFSTKDQSYSIQPYMIESPAFKIGEEVEVRDRDNDHWEIKIFVGYTYNTKWKYRVESSLTTSNGFVFCRAIKEPEIEITIKINGRPAKLSDISDETLKKIKEAE